MIGTTLDLSSAARISIAALILGQRRVQPESMLGVGSGWSGPKTLLDAPEMQPFRELFDSAAQLGYFGHTAIEWCAWANIMERGDTIDWHTHERSHLGGANLYSGVYYFDAPRESGRLEYVAHDGSVGVVEPQPGMLLWFPATLAHRVLVHESDQPRISIAFNGRPAPQEVS